MTRPTVLSTFTGLGGLDLGLEAAGFESVGCIEVNPTARRSLKTNRPEWRLVEPGDILIAAHSLVPADVGVVAGELSLLAGAPPCQPYSKAAMWAQSAWQGHEDPRAQPLGGFLTLLDKFQPVAFVLENVPGFARGRHSALAMINDALARINRRRGTSYSADVRFLRAQDHGVPQKRQRAFVVGLRNGGDIPWPTPTHEHSPIRAWDALAELEPPRRAPKPTGRWAGLLPSIPEGWNYIWHTDRGGGLPLFGYRTRYWSFLLKLAKERPSWTIPAQPGPAVGPFHWDNRPLTTAELLRLQTFPVYWAVEGQRREQVLQVGNATPPLLAEVVGKVLRQSIDGTTVSTPLVYAISPQTAVPDPEPASDVPATFLDLMGSHPAHNGTGNGPRPRATKVQL